MDGPKVKYCVYCGNEFSPTDSGYRRYLDFYKREAVRERRIDELCRAAGIDRTDMKTDDAMRQRYVSEIAPQVPGLDKDVSFVFDAEHLGLYCDGCKYPYFAAGDDGIAGSGVVSNARFCPFDGTELKIEAEGYAPFDRGGSALLYCLNRDGFSNLASEAVANMLGAEALEEARRN